jgi:transcriptional regulator with XRE-family HTH domain
MESKTQTQSSLERGSSGPSAVGARIRQLRREKGLTQGDIERRTGLMRCYISRVENGYKSPSLGTLERFARALEVPLYQIFYAAEGPVCLQGEVRHPTVADSFALGKTAGPEASFLRKLSSLWSRTGHFEHKVLFNIAKRMAARAGEGSSPNAHEVLSFAMQSGTRATPKNPKRTDVGVQKAPERRGNWPGAARVN